MSCGRAVYHMYGGMLRTAALTRSVLSFWSFCTALLAYDASDWGGGGGGGTHLQRERLEWQGGDGGTVLISCMVVVVRHDQEPFHPPILPEPSTLGFFTDQADIAYTNRATGGARGRKELHEASITSIPNRATLVFIG